MMVFDDVDVNLILDNVGNKRQLTLNAEIQAKFWNKNVQRYVFTPRLYLPFVSMSVPPSTTLQNNNKKKNNNYNKFDDSGSLCIMEWNRVIKKRINNSIQ